ncbi:hypothetical protein L873DRAFT_1801812 [Choiromyces venosus 120613-1]|uniref:Uncharacterized protein n=1 Tax=Choiromyces venosus 120613-1 TaxID=1336337 RepID=A0A3N4JWQ9_9PEZI|nr:hypothetical protein L873DRAFT_1801812 [Choiromyces venosus 120613-1]
MLPHPPSAQLHQTAPMLASLTLTFSYSPDTLLLFLVFSKYHGLTPICLNSLLTPAFHLLHSLVPIPNNCKTIPNTAKQSRYN